MALAVCGSQLLYNCQISKTGINHTPQTLFGLTSSILISYTVFFPLYVLVFPHFSFGVASHLFSSVMQFTLPSTASPLILLFHKVTRSRHHLRLLVGV